MGISSSNASAASTATDQPLTALLLFLSILLSLLVLSQALTKYTSAYLTAPEEINTFLTTATSSLLENESYDHTISRLPRLEDKLRLSQLLREIQKCGDDLREELNSVLVDECSTTLKMSARLLWASRRKGLEERVRRMDLLRMRFLVVYMGIVASGVASHDKPVGDKEKHAAAERTIPKMALRPSLMEAIQAGKEGGGKELRKPPLRRLTTQAMGHSDNQVGGGHRMGWAGVVQELQRSPLMHKRHASIEGAMSPKGSP
jgi:hypothetical protein